MSQVSAAASPLASHPLPDEPPIHIVVRGESLWGIARQHGISLAQLEAANPRVAAQSYIHPGDRLVIPGSGSPNTRVHVVRAGETVGGIARRHGSDVAEIASANGLRDPDHIVPGQQLVIPGGRAHPAARAVPPRTAPAPSAPTAAPVRPEAAVPTGAATRGSVRALFDPALGSRAPGAIIIGQAEGTRTPSGGFTAAYGEHIDPGNAAVNRGSFSLQNARGLTPDAADRRQLAALTERLPVLERAARAAGVDPNDPALATAYLDLYNQSPTAAARFLDQIGTLRATGVTNETLTDLRVHSYVDRSTGQRFRDSHDRPVAGGLATIARRRLGRVPSEAEVQQTIRADQGRRQRAMARVLPAYTDASGPTPSPTPTRASPATRPEAIRFAHSGGLDLSPTVIAAANGLSDRVRASTGHAIHITSGRRGPARQADAMYGNFANNSTPRYSNQVAFGEVRDAYRAGRAAGESRNAVVARMTRVLTAQVDRGVYISNHMRDGSVDVRYAPRATRQAVIDAIAADPAVRRVGVEGNHLHVDFR